MTVTGTGTGTGKDCRFAVPPNPYADSVHLERSYVRSASDTEVTASITVRRGRMSSMDTSVPVYHPHTNQVSVSTRRLPAEIARGLRDVAPLLIGIIPFGLVAGAAAVESGLRPSQAVGLSVIVFAGASQLAVIDLLGQNATLSIAVITGVVINLRILMYSASIAPSFQSFRPRWKAIAAYVLTDQAYALSISRYAEKELSRTERRRYYLTVAFTLWIVWQICTIAGVVIGARVPDEWGLGFAVPLVFLSLLIPAAASGPAIAAAVVGGTVGTVGTVYNFPFNLGLITGGAAGVIAGVVVDSYTETSDESSPEDNH